MVTTALKIHGMDCAEEVKSLKAELGPRQGVQELAFDVLNGKLTVTHSEATITRDDLIAGVARTGMKAEPWPDARQRVQEVVGWQKWGRTVATVTSGVLIVAGYLTDALLRGPWKAFADDVHVPLTVRLIYLAAVVAGAWFVLPKAWRALLRLRPDMNLLMTVAV